LARFSSACFSSCTLRSTSRSRSPICCSSFASLSFSSSAVSSSARRCAIWRSRSSRSASVPASAAARRSSAAACEATSCSSRTSRPETSTCSCNDARRSCSRASEALSSARRSWTSGLAGSAAAIASPRERGSSGSLFSLARRPEPKPPSVLLCSGATVTPRLVELEDLGQVQERRPEDDDEHRREDERDGRKEHLDRRLHRLLLCQQLTLEPRVACLDAEDPTQRDTELVGLDDRADEARHLLRRAPLGHLFQRLLAAFADAHLAEGE